MAAQRPAPGVIPPLRKRVPELARTVVSGPVLARGLVDSASGCCTAPAPSPSRSAAQKSRSRVSRAGRGGRHPPHVHHKPVDR